VKVLIIGAGMQGHVLTWNLARCNYVTEILVADYDEVRARFVVDQVGGGKAKAIHLDAADVASITAAAAGLPGRRCRLHGHGGRADPIYDHRRGLLGAAGP
jgi:phosphoribosylamine-glycine ligase